MASKKDTKSDNVAIMSKLAITKYITDLDVVSDGTGSLDSEAAKVNEENIKEIGQEFLTSSDAVHLQNIARK